MKFKHIGVLIFISSLIFSCNNSSNGKKGNTDSLNNIDSLKVKTYERNRIDPIRDSVLLSYTKEIIADFKNKKYDSLIKFMDPNKGIRFSPYTFVDTLKDQILLPATILDWKDKKNQPLIIWGIADASGEAINLTLDDYVKKYVYDVDFLKADSIVANRFIGAGTMQNNIFDIYPDAVFTESYFKGKNKNTENLDWRSLRLIFEKTNEKYFLIGIVHDEWTI